MELRGSHHDRRARGHRAAHQLAGAASRYIAGGIDLACAAHVDRLPLIVTLVIGGVARGLTSGWAAAGFIVSVFTVFYLYDVLFEVLA